MNRKAETTVDRILRTVKNHKFFAVLIVLGIAVIAVATFVRSVRDLVQVFRKEQPVEDSFASPSFVLEGTIALEAGVVLPKSARVGLLWGLEDDDQYSWGTTEIHAGEDALSYRLPLKEPQPPDKALMFITSIGNAEGVNTPSLRAKLGIAYIIVFEDKNGTENFENDEDEMLAASPQYCVTYLSGKLPPVPPIQGLEQGYSIAKAFPLEGHEGWDGLSSTSSNTKVRIFVAKDRKIKVPNWT